MKKNNIKIIIFSKSSWNTYNFRKDIIQYFLSKKFKVTIVTERDNFYKQLSNLGCEIKFINYQNTKFNPFLDFFNLFKIYKIIQKIKPSYILSYNLKPIILSNIVSQICSRKNISMITGVGSTLDKKNIYYYLAILLYKIALRKCHTVFFQNNNDKDFFERNYILNKSNVDIIPGSGVNLNYFIYKKINFENSITFLCASRLIISKGIVEFCESAFIVKKIFPNVVFRLIGNFEDSSRGIKKQFIQNFVNKKIIEYKEFSNNIIEEIYNSSCAILPSYREGTSKFLLEAMSCGRPIITSDAIGCAQLVDNNKNGFIFKKKNYIDLSEKIIEFINLTNNEKNIMSINSRNLIERKYDIKFVINKYNQIIND
tara:strand:- start:189 stop:1298 length:1110 start_codon:yes stop_codon:yes gene_type:complete